jgi:hypothetical protein
MIRRSVIGKSNKIMAGIVTLNHTFKTPNLKSHNELYDSRQYI